MGRLTRKQRRARARWMRLYERHQRHTHHTRVQYGVHWITYRTLELLEGPLKVTDEVGRWEGVHIVERP